jgi:hypothetical protein
MRTKVLLSAAALVAASALSSLAQNVYSLNVVGYINLSLTPGYNLVANQLDLDGTGTNNTVAGVFGTQLPAGSEVYTWNGTGFNAASIFSVPRTGGAAAWTQGGTAPLNPGMGCYIQVPSAVTVTTVGQVLQGSLVNPNIPAAGGYALLSSMVPISGTITSLNYVATAGDQIFFWDNTLTPPGFDPAYNYTVPRTGGAATWAVPPGVPTINVGQGFFLNAKAANTVWSNYFTIQ